MAKRKYDLAVKVGQYTDAQGQSKNRYHNIGVVMQGDDGGHYMLLDPMVNLAAVPREAGKDRVMVSMFTPKEDGAAPAPRHAARPVPPPVEDEVPF